MVETILSVSASIITISTIAWYLRGRLDYQDFMLNSLRERVNRVEKKIDEL